MPAELPHRAQMDILRAISLLGHVGELLMLVGQIEIIYGEGSSIAQALMENLESIEALLPEVNAKIDSFLGFDGPYSGNPFQCRILLCLNSE